MIEQDDAIDRVRFVKERLPALIAGRKSLRVVVATYRNIGIDRPTGFVKDLPEGLSMYVQTGDFPPVAGFDAEPALIVPMMVKQMHDTGVFTQPPDLAFIYDGKNAGTSVLALAEIFGNIGTRVVLFTCSCSIRVKQPLYREMRQNGSIHDVILSECQAQQEILATKRSLRAMWSECRLAS